MNSEFATRTMTPPFFDRHIIPIFLLLLSMLSYVLLEPIGTSEPDNARAMLLQSSLPKPESWTNSKGGGTRNFGAVTVILPSGFTNQSSGANVFSDMMTRPSGLKLPSGAVPGTEFALGIWPANDQTDYQKPIEIRIVINAAHVSEGEEKNLVVSMYDPQSDRWVPQPTGFRPSSYEVVTHIHSFTPVAKEFPVWGGRTFFIVVNIGEVRTAQPPTVNRPANLRAGPGTNYSVVGRVLNGRQLELAGRTSDGRWYQLTDGTWIAAFLVDNVSDIPIVEITPMPSLRAPTSTPSTSVGIPAAPVTGQGSTKPTLQTVGALTLASGQGINLEDGKISSMASADILFLVEETDQFYLVPLKGAKLAVMGTKRITVNDCTSIQLATATIEINQLPDGIYICAINNQGQIARLRINKLLEPNNTMLRIFFVVWKHDD